MYQVATVYFWVSFGAACLVAPRKVMRFFEWSWRRPTPLPKTQTQTNVWQLFGFLILAGVVIKMFLDAH
jgi:hypothetical protein